MTDQPVVIERDNGSGAIVAIVTLIVLALIGYFASVILLIITGAMVRFLSTVKCGNKLKP